jgi:SAM-dependent methyltransferase
MADLLERAAQPGERHPWEEVRFSFFAEVLARSGLLTPSLRVLDVGAGDAWFARQLAERLPAASRIVCWDVGYSDEVLAGIDGSEGALELVRERPGGRFDLALLLDVLEHVEDDRSFLRALVEDGLAPRGHALVSVPAWPALFSEHDRALRHHRRYAPSAARALLEDAGLEIVSSGGLFHSLVAPRALGKLRERMGAGASRHDLSSWRAPRWITALVRGVLACDARLAVAEAALGWSVPGLSWWALCRRASR